MVDPRLGCRTHTVADHRSGDFKMAGQRGDAFEWSLDPLGSLID